MRISVLLLFLIAAAIPQAAAQKESEWDEFRFTEYDREVAAGLMKVQKLMQGREALLQSYDRSDQSAIATEREIEKFRQDQINTQKTRLAYYEAMVNFKFPEPGFDDNDELPADELPTNEALPLWSDIEEEPPLPIPPMFKIHSLSETSDGLSIQIENLGSEINALISVTDLQGTIISSPYQSELANWDEKRWLSFRLLSRSDKINLLIQSAAGKNYRIPLFIREQVSDPRIMAFPLEQKVKIGESAEYTIVIEGDGNDRGRYPIRIRNFPDGIAWQIAKVIPAATPEGQPRSIPIRNVMFSPAFNRHELALQLTLGRDLPKSLIGKPIQFTLRIGAIRETLSITPIGVGELTIDVPAVVQVRLGETKEIRVKLQNVGTEMVSRIMLQSAGTTYGVDVSAKPISLATDALRELPVNISIASDVSLGERDVRLIVSSSAGSQTATLKLEIMPKAMRFALLRGMVTPALVILVAVGLLLGGMKAQEIRQKRAQEKAKDYDLIPTYEVGGDD